MTLIWVAGLTLVVIFAALFAGIYLDKLLHTSPYLTVLLAIGSIPLTIYLTYRVVKAATKRSQPVTKTENPKEESIGGSDK